jgi:TonB family protein
MNHQEHLPFDAGFVSGLQVYWGRLKTFIWVLAGSTAIFTPIFVAVSQHDLRLLMFIGLIVLVTLWRVRTTGQSLERSGTIVVLDLPAHPLDDGKQTNGRNETNVVELGPRTTDSIDGGKRTSDWNQSYNDSFEPVVVGSALRYPARDSFDIEPSSRLTINRPWVRANFGLLPEFEKSPASYVTSAVVNLTILALIISAGMTSRQVVEEHHYEQTILIFPTTPPPPLRRPALPSIVPPNLSNFGTGSIVVATGIPGRARTVKKTDSYIGGEVIVGIDPSTGAPVTLTGVAQVLILSAPELQYTSEARALSVEGDVVLEVIFTATGQVLVQRVIHRLGHGLDEEAIRGTEQIRFRPATRNGRTVDVKATITIGFRLSQIRSGKPSDGQR